jgi:hypothetical protein
MESTPNPIKSIIDFQYLNQKCISQDRIANTEKITKIEDIIKMFNMIRNNI